MQFANRHEHSHELKAVRGTIKAQVTYFHIFCGLYNKQLAAQTI